MVGLAACGLGVECAVYWAYWSDLLPEGKNMSWTPPQRPAALTEARLIEAILTGQYPINSTLPAERDLADQLGVTRPTLREALQRMARDGWLDIQHGKSTRVRNYWEEGSLGVLNALAGHSQHLPQDFIPKLLQVRLLLAPAYTHDAVQHHPEDVDRLLSDLVNTPGDAAAFTKADWTLHHALARLSGNPVFSLILNGFSDLYHNLGVLYFSSEDNRSHSLHYYQQLYQHSRDRDADAARSLTRTIMQASIARWEQLRAGE